LYYNHNSEITVSLARELPNTQLLLSETKKDHHHSLTTGDCLTDWSLTVLSAQ